VPEIVLLDMSGLRAAHAVLVEMFADDPEPMPEWGEADRSKLEMCCHCTETSAFGKQKYPGLVPKAAKLFYSGIKLHVFPNGNKRFGVVVLLLFLILNDRRLEAEPGELAYMAQHVASADPRKEATKHDRVVVEIVDFLEARIRPGPLNDS
jgi:death-on-curing family protein